MRPRRSSGGGVRVRRAVAVVLGTLLILGGWLAAFGGDPTIVLAILAEASHGLVLVGAYLFVRRGPEGGGQIRAIAAWCRESYEPFPDVSVTVLVLEVSAVLLAVTATAGLLVFGNLLFAPWYAVEPADPDSVAELVGLVAESRPYGHVFTVLLVTAGVVWATAWAAEGLTATALRPSRDE